MYRSIPSLKEYVVIEQIRAGAKRYVRQTGLKWVLEEILGLDAILILESVHCEIPLRELYLRVELDPEA